MARGSISHTTSRTVLMRARHAYVGDLSGAPVEKLIAFPPPPSSASVTRNSNLPSLLGRHVSQTTVCDTLLVFRDGMSRQRQPEPTERVLQLPELGEKRLRLLQILGVEAFGEPVVDRGEQLIRLLALALALP